MEQIVQVFKALSDETRLQILLILSKRSICAKGIARHLQISEAAVSQHIKILKEAGLLIGEKTGYFVQYNLQQSVFEDMIGFIEQISGTHTSGHYKDVFSVPFNCQYACKAQREKCCERSSNE
ncbi:MAG: metalloregulator ArsR/SmtB family transcription factor [Dehalobacter sp.]|nr:metalloregulator ArsR/SmtB family transcription factor [Dehalobacter sp.]